MASKRKSVTKLLKIAYVPASYLKKRKTTKRKTSTKKRKTTRRKRRTTKRKQSLL